MILVPYPDGIEYKEWSEITYGVLVDELGAIIPQPGAWQLWADELRLVDQLVELPQSGSSASWQEWALRLIEVVQGI